MSNITVNSANNGKHATLKEVINYDFETYFDIAQNEQTNELKEVEKELSKLKFSKQLNLQDQINALHKKREQLEAPLKQELKNKKIVLILNIFKCISDQRSLNLTLFDEPDSRQHNYIDYKSYIKQWIGLFFKDETDINDDENYIVKVIANFVQPSWIQKREYYDCTNKMASGYWVLEFVKILHEFDNEKKTSYLKSFLNIRIVQNYFFSDLLELLSQYGQEFTTPTVIHNDLIFSNDNKNLGNIDENEEHLFSLDRLIGNIDHNDIISFIINFIPNKQQQDDAIRNFLFNLKNLEISNYNMLSSFQNIINFSSGIKSICALDSNPSLSLEGLFTIFRPKDFKFYKQDIIKEAIVAEFQSLDDQVDMYIKQGNLMALNYNFDVFLKLLIAKTLADTNCNNRYNDNLKVSILTECDKLFIHDFSIDELSLILQFVIIEAKGEYGSKLSSLLVKKLNLFSKEEILKIVQFSKKTNINSKKESYSFRLLQSIIGNEFLATPGGTFDHKLIKYNKITKSRRFRLIALSSFMLIALYIAYLTYKASSIKKLLCLISEILNVKMVQVIRLIQTMLSMINNNAIVTCSYFALFNDNVRPTLFAYIYGIFLVGMAALATYIYHNYKKYPFYAKEDMKHAFCTIGTISTAIGVLMPFGMMVYSYLKSSANYRLALFTYILYASIITIIAFAIRISLHYGRYTFSVKNDSKFILCILGITAIAAAILMPFGITNLIFGMMISISNSIITILKNIANPIIAILANTANSIKAISNYISSNNDIIRTLYGFIILSSVCGMVYVYKKDHKDLFLVLLILLLEISLIITVLLVHNTINYTFLSLVRNATGTIFEKAMNFISSIPIIFNKSGNITIFGCILTVSIFALITIASCGFSVENYHNKYIEDIQKIFYSTVPIIVATGLLIVSITAYNLLSTICKIICSLVIAIPSVTYKSLTGICSIVKTVLIAIYEATYSIVTITFNAIFYSPLDTIYCAVIICVSMILYECINIIKSKESGLEFYLDNIDEVSKINLNNIEHSY